MPYATFDKFEIEITLKDAETCSHAGECVYDVDVLLESPYIATQFEALKEQDIIDTLLEYGCWDIPDLKDPLENKQKLLWIACGDISEGR